MNQLMVLPQLFFFSFNGWLFSLAGENGIYCTVYCRLVTVVYNVTGNMFGKMLLKCVV